MRVILAVLVVWSAVGCSNRAVYENMQINQRNECVKLPPAEYDACMEGITKRYDEYERERREVMDE